MLAVVLSKDARARAVQLPAWNEALGLPRPWDQQWSLRLQQIVAYETDLLDFDDIFDGSRVIAEKVEQLKFQAREELTKIDEMGGAVVAVESSYMKRRLVESNAKRLAAIEAGEQIVVGVNKFTEAEPSPLATGDESIITVDPMAEQQQIAALRAWRAGRDAARAEAALAELAAAAREGRNIMEPSIACAHAGVTTGEWSGCLREIFGEYRAPTGVGQAVVTGDLGGLKTVRAKVETLTDKLGRRIKMLVGKPGLDGHSNGAEQIALRARDAGFEVVYEGIRLTPEQIVSAALEEGVHVVGLSILSGSHIPLVTEIMHLMKEADLSDVPVIVGGIIPLEDAQALIKVGVARVYTPKDFDLNQIMADILAIVEETALEAA